MEGKNKQKRYTVLHRSVADREDNFSKVASCPTNKLAENVCRCLNNCDSMDKQIAKYEAKKYTNKP